MKNYWLFAILALACVAAVTIITAPVGPQLYHPTSQPYQSADHRQQTGPKSEISITAIFHAKGAPNANGGTNVESDNGPKWTDIVQAVSAVFIGFLTIALVCIYRRQTNVMAEQARIMGVQASTMINQTSVLTESLRVSRSALRETEKSTLAAMAAVRSAENTAERELRAYVTVSGGTIRNSRDPSKRSAVITIKNCGQTPAYDQTTWIGTGTREFPLLSALQTRPSELPLGRNVLSPGQVSFIDSPVGPLNGATEIKISDGNMAVYIFGQIDYRDIFGVERFTKFRLFCSGEAMLDGRLHPDVEGNEAN